MAKINWGAGIKSKGWDGLNNAAINTFNSDIIKSFVREMFQNSNDARQKGKDGEKKKLKIELEYKTITEQEFPGFSQLRSIIEAIAKDPANSGNEQFFTQALESIKDEKRISVLEYRDYNTTGLSGDDTEPKSTFSACVLSEGITNKSDKTAGGSYGIGKNSIFGFSKIRTVLYSSKNVKGELIFQGVAKLASYRSNGNTFESRIFLGEGSDYKSIRDFSKLSKKQRSFLMRDKAGLTQLAISPVKNEQWKDEFAKAILKNYWLLLSTDELEVTLREEGKELLNISSKTFENLLVQYFSAERGDSANDTKPYGSPLDFYLCYRNVLPVKDNIHAVGEVSLFYKELPHKNTNRIAYIRNGMVIYTEAIAGFSSIGYCGVIIANEKEGNEVLRMMEPPTHDSFDPSRLSEKTNKYNEADGKRAKKGMRDLIVDELNRILDKYRKDADEIPWLNELLNTINGSSGTGNGSRTGTGSEKETISRVSSEKIHNLSFHSVYKNSAVSTRDGDKKEPGGGSGKKNEKGPGGGKKPGGGNEGNKKKKNVSKAVVDFRIFRESNGANDSINSYKIIIRSPQSYKDKDLIITQIGDSGKAASFNIEQLVDQNGKDVSFEKVKNRAGELTGYKLKKIDLPNMLHLKVDEPYSSAFMLTEI